MNNDRCAYKPFLAAAARLRAAVGLSSQLSTPIARRAPADGKNTDQNVCQRHKGMSKSEHLAAWAVKVRETYSPSLLATQQARAMRGCPPHTPGMPDW